MAKGPAGMMIRFGAFALAMLGLHVAASARELSVRQAERIDAGAVATLELASETGTSVHLAFRAYGRDLSLSLEPNDRLLSSLRGGLLELPESLRVYRGRVNGDPGTWVRLTRVGEDWSGAFWDGRELHALVSAARLPSALKQSLSVAHSDLAVYRLSDVDSPPGAVCGVGPEQTLGGAELYESLVGELQAALAANVPPEEIQVALIGDFEFSNENSPGAMVQRINIVDGIFSEQVGVAILPSELRVFTNADDPFTATHPSRLLEELGGYRESTPEIRDAGLAHLFTGKTLDGGVLGVAYIDALCEPFGGVGLSMDTTNEPLFNALVVAHEIGHNFGAWHDNEAGSPCEIVPDAFLMAPRMNFSETFSQCSLDTMRPRVAAAECITPSRLGDVTVEAQASVTASTNVPFEFAVDVRSIGTGPANNVTLSVRSVFSWTASATAEQGSCAGSGQEVTCQFDAIPAAESRRVTVRATRESAGTIEVSSDVSAANDRVLTNNSATTQVVTSVAADVKLGPPQTVTGFTRETNSFFVDVISTGPQDIQDATVNINLLGFTLVAATPDSGSCTPSGTISAVCTFGTIPGGTTRRIQVQFSGTQARTVNGQLRVSASNDGNTFNNFSGVTMVLAAAADARATVTPVTQLAVVGQAFNYTATIESIGPQTVNDVTAFINGSTSHSVESVTPDGGSCVEDIPDQRFTCTFGGLPSGASRRIDVTARALQLGTTGTGIFVTATNDDNTNNNSANLQLTVLEPVDVMLSALPFVSNLLETQQATRRFEIRSLGLNPAVGATLTAAFPAAVAVLAARVAGGSCTITGSNVTCNLPALVRGTPTFVEFDLRGDQVGQHVGNVTLSAPNDASAGNDTLTPTFNVLPFVDVALGIGGNLVALLNEPVVLEVTVSTGPQPVNNVFVTFNLSNIPETVDSVQPSSCQGGEQLVCQFATLAARTATTLRITLRGLNTGTFTVPIRVTSSINHNHENDEGSVSIRFERPPDAFVNTGMVVNGELNQVISYELAILVDADARPVNDVVFSASLPASFALISASADSGTCSGSAPGIVCNLGTLQSGVRRIQLSVRPSAAGTFISNLTLTSSNDTNAQNNTGTVTITVAGPPAPPPPPSNNGGGGGGGSLGLAGLLLLLPLLERWRRVASGTRSTALH